MKTALIVFVIGSLLFLILGALAPNGKLVTFKYIEFYDPHPNAQSLNVVSQEGNFLRLDDGRTLRIEGPGTRRGPFLHEGRRGELEAYLDLPEQWREFELDTPCVVTLDDSPGQWGPGQCVLLERRRRRLVCGNPYMGLIRIPLDPTRIPEYGHHRTARVTWLD